MDPIQGFEIFSKITATGALIWVVWFTLSKTIPQLIDKFTAETAAARTVFLAELKDARLQYASELAASRDNCREELERFIAHATDLRPPKA